MRYFILLGIGFQYFRGIGFRVDGKRGDAKIRIAIKFVLKFNHTLIHNGANAWTCGKKELHYIYSSRIIFVGDLPIVLIGELKIGSFPNSMQVTFLKMGYNFWDAPYSKNEYNE